MGRLVAAVSLPGDIIDVGGLAVDGTDVWITSRSSQGDLLLVRGGAITMRIRVGWAPGAVAYGVGGVWVADTFGDGSRPGARQNDVARIDPVSGREVARINVMFPSHIVIAGGAPWVAAGNGNSVASTVDRIDPATNTITARIPISGAITGLVAINGSLWVTSTALDEARGWLSRVDPAAERLTSTTPLPGSPGSLVGVGAELWVQLPGADPSTARVVILDSTGTSVLATRPDTPLLVGLMGADGNSIWILREDVLARLNSKDLTPMGAAVALPPVVGQTIIGSVVAPQDVWILRSGELLQVSRTQP